MICSTLELKIETINDPYELDRLSKSPDVLTRRKVVVNRSTSSDTLIYLSHDPDWVVRFCIPHHPNCPLGALHVLKNDSFSYVRLRVFSVLRLDAEVLDYGVSDYSPEVRSLVASHPNTSIEMLTVLAKDKDKHVSEVARERLSKPL